jgi:hypothetical protein
MRRRAPNDLSSLQGGLDVRRRRARIAWRGEVGSIVGEDGMGPCKGRRRLGGAGSLPWCGAPPSSVSRRRRTSTFSRGRRGRRACLAQFEPRRRRYESSRSEALTLRLAEVSLSTCGNRDTGEGTSASDAGSSAAGHRGSRRAAAKCASGRQRRRPLPLLTGLSIWAAWVLSAGRKRRTALSTGDRLWVDAVALRKPPQALLTMLCRSTDASVLVALPCRTYPIGGI